MQIKKCKNKRVPDEGLESSEDVEDFLSLLLSRFGIFVVVVFLPAGTFVAAVTAFIVSISGFLIDLSAAVAAAGAVLVFDPMTSVSIESSSFFPSVFGTSF